MSNKVFAEKSFFGKNLLPKIVYGEQFLWKKVFGEKSFRQKSLGPKKFRPKKLEIPLLVSSAKSKKVNYEGTNYTNHRIFSTFSRQKEKKTKTIFKNIFSHTVKKKR